MDADREVHRRLTAVRDGVRRAGNAPAELLLDAMEAIMTAGFFDDEQLARMRRRHEEIGPGDFAGWLSRATELTCLRRAFAAGFPGGA